MKNQEGFCLSIDPVSQNPGLALKKFSDSTSEILRLSFLNDSNTGLRKYDSANFVDKIAEICEKADCKPKSIKRLVICNGPGAFSPIRVVTIISRVLYSLNVDLQVYKFNFLYLLFKKLKSQKLLNSPKTIINLKAGLQGYFREVYDLENENVLEAAQLVKVCEDGIRLDSDSELLNFDFAGFMLQLLAEPNHSNFQVSSLEELTPYYLREASVTVKKK